ncbi:phosphotransferase family protein [Tenggerimyces flavus]|uniref:Phosphotransferase family protein n=1 Tax=Tenggerimyces flavus TaxID=1708749 RepID=A0ABV7YCK3_9ACTN|nr:phosphotransferase [Tenggerimyces flavus]MBM7783336.1 aminoglycoside phosphotransferase (APT) family kinase protein [Tenggerimyces flavus]
MESTWRPLSERVRAWAEGIVGSIHAVERLTGGLTADIDRLSVGAVDVVLRRWGDRRWGRELVAREATGLRALAGRGVPAPVLVAADSGEVAGEPCLLMTALPGRQLLRSPNIAELATTLAHVHDLDPTGLAATDPHGFDERRVDGWIRDPALAETVKQTLATELDESAPVLVHGDYQLLNTLWRNDDLTGVVDWTYTGSGRRETDVGLCRASLAVLVSADAADTFLRRYEAEAGVRIDPNADLRALMSFGPSWLGFLTDQLGAPAPNQLEAVVLRAASRLG